MPERDHPQWTTTHRAVAAAVANAAGVPEPLPAPLAASLPAGEPVDWDLFRRLVVRHQVTSLVHRSGLLGPLGAPDDVVVGIQRDARRAAVRALAQLRFLTGLLAALRGAGIDAVVLKGLPLAQAGYGDVAARDPGDVDLLVDPVRVPDVADLLTALGLRLHSWRRGPTPDRIEAVLHCVDRLPALHEVTFHGAGMTVDLHWRLFGNRRLQPVRPGWLRDPAIVRIGQTEVPVLPVDQLWPFLVRHGAKHSWRQLKWLADVPALAGRHPELLTCRRPATDPAAERCVAAALLVAEEVFGRFVPDAYRSEVIARSGTAVLRRQAGLALGTAAEPDERIGPRQVGSHLRTKAAVRGGAGHRREEARIWLIRAGRAQLVPDPGALTLLAGPMRWTVRYASPPARRARARLSGLPWLSGLRRLTGRRGRLLIEAAVELSRSSVELAALPPRRIVPLLGDRAAPPEPAAPPARAAADAAAAAAVGAAVAGAARRLPWRPTCLRQAVAAGRMLRRRGIGGRVHLGVSSRSGALAAHAWVTVDGTVVLGGRNTDRFTPVAAFTLRRRALPTRAASPAPPTSPPATTPPPTTPPATTPPATTPPARIARTRTPPERSSR